VVALINGNSSSDKCVTGGAVGASVSTDHSTFGGDCWTIAEYVCTLLVTGLALSGGEQLGDLTMSSQDGVASPATTKLVALADGN
jgi:hypothetical protein